MRAVAAFLFGCIIAASAVADQDQTIVTRAWTDHDVVRAYQCGAMLVAVTAISRMTVDPVSQEPADCTQYRVLAQGTKP